MPQRQAIGMAKNICVFYFFFIKHVFCFIDLPLHLRNIDEVMGEKVGDIYQIVFSKKNIKKFV